MKVILVNERLGHTRTYVIKGWLKGVLSLCLLGAPVALGYLGYQLSLQQAGSEEAAVHHSLKGAPKTAEMQWSADDTASPVTVFVQPPTDSHTVTSGGMMSVAARSPSTAVPLRYAVQPERHRFRHGRSIDPATYQRRVYS